jgi:dihydrolipoamide dehydrogenase
MAAISQLRNGIAEPPTVHDRQIAKEGDDGEYMEKRFDLTIVGGGPGGYVAAIRASQLGLKVAVVEEGEMGGTCLNRGCIPTKALLQSAELYHLMGRSAEFGITASVEGINYAKLSERKASIVKRLRLGVESLVRKAGGTMISGRAGLLDNHTLTISGADSGIIKTSTIIIATGSRPSRPPIPGIDGARVLDSNQVLELHDCPRSVVIIGGGVIGVEFATLFNLLGKKVGIVEMTGSLVPSLDLEIAGLLRKSLEARGIEVFTDSRVSEMLSGPSQESPLTCRFEVGGEKFQAEGDFAIVSTGRRPNIEGLGLEALGIALEKGHIKVNGGMETSIPGIYAIGDVVGTWQLAHAASAQGMVAAANAAGGHAIMDNSVIPACIYSCPEIATVGLTEKAARDRGLDVRIGRFPVAANGKSMIFGEKEGMAKIVTDRSTGEILGAHIMAPRATEMIGEICVAMRLEATSAEIADTVHPHPTASEMLMEAAMDAEGRGLHQPGTGRK